MNKLLLLRNSWLVFAHDILWIPVSAYAAFCLRFNLGDIPDEYIASLYALILIALPTQIIAFMYFGLYRGIWRFASIPDFFRIVRAVAVGVAITAIAMFIIQRLEGIPRSVLVLYPVLLMLGLTTPRLMYRWMKDNHLKIHPHQRKRTLIIGADQAGDLLVRDLLKSGPFEPIGFLDDTPRRLGQEIHGIRVIGPVSKLEETARKLAIEVVLIAIPSASHQLIRQINQTCAGMRIICRILPSMQELADGKISVNNLRSIRIEDVLGRDSIQLNNETIRAFINHKRILVTGAGGSIGSELCRQILAAGPSNLVLLDNSEFNLYSMEQELHDRIPDHADMKHSLILGDVRDMDRMEWVLKEFSPEVIFHAAAYKHVPLVEDNPAEGVKTNFLGTAQLADMAVKYKVKKFVLISTDKAVNPANVMGATKRAAEIYCQNLDDRSPDTAFVTTRFGNVLGSTGSVVPKFSKQIAEGGPVTVTHPEMTRFFMTIPEAVSLILQAGTMGCGGEIYVLDMGEPVNILNLAEQMIRLSGLEPERDIQIEFSGLRPGEKMYEELFYDSEALQPTANDKIMLAQSRKVDWTEMQHQKKMLRDACITRDIEEVRELLKQLVPEFIGSTK